jgi:hypothetical protein
MSSVAFSVGTTTLPRQIGYQSPGIDPPPNFPQPGETAFSKSTASRGGIQCVVESGFFLGGHDAAGVDRFFGANLAGARRRCPLSHTEEVGSFSKCEHRRDRRSQDRCCRRHRTHPANTAQGGAASCMFPTSKIGWASPLLSNT